ncbi:MAG: long-chain fatty acid--CoA ligase [Treponema sp.]|nr:long-chain fatty acid--CoA ligase [Treponema sp.]
MAKTKFPMDKTLPKNMALLIKERCSRYADENLQAAKGPDGKFKYYTYSQVYESVIEFALGLKTVNVHRGSNVALISDNRREWLISDYALVCIGAADVPRGCDSMGNEIRFIVSYADCEVGIFENFRQLKKITEKEDEVPLLKTAILFDAPSDSEMKELKSSRIDVRTFEEILNEGKKIYESDRTGKRAEFEAEMEKTEPDDTITMIFTSGTTGTPKGVMLTHKNYLTHLSCVPTFLPGKPGEWWLSVLPVWHVFERLIQYVALQLGCGLAYSKPIASVMLSDMAEIRPQWMCGVPRLWEALAKGVNRAMKKKGGIALKLYNFFLSVGIHYANNRDRVLGHVCRLKKRNRFLDGLVGFFPFIALFPLHKLGDALVFKKLRAKFGGRLSIAISGGGALQKEIDDFYRAVGLNLLEGYGLSETCPVVSFRYYREPRPGCVGAIFPSWEVKILKEKNGVPISDEPLPPGEQGLIYVRGNQLMKGYYKRQDLTDAVIDSDGWFNTGDLGIRTYDNELKITGRAKDTIVLSGGENVEPAMIERGLSASPYIESSMVLGQDKKYLGVIIVPNRENVNAYAAENGLASGDYVSLLNSAEIQKLFESEIESCVSPERGFRTCEKVNRFALVPKSFEVGDELSAKQEIIRHKIAEKYSGLIDEMFKEN